MLATINYDAIISSIAPRAHQTAAIIREHQERKWPDLSLIETLYNPFGTPGLLIDQMAFGVGEEKGLGNASISEYRKHEHFPELERYGDIARDAIWAEIIRQFPDGGNELNILVVGHGVFNPMIAVSTTRGANVSGTDPELVSMQECSVLRLEFHADPQEVVVGYTELPA